MKRYSSAEATAARQAAEQKAREEILPATHEENEWKIETVSEDITEVDAGLAAKGLQREALAEGLQFELPVSCHLLQKGIQRALGCCNISCGKYIAFA